MKRYSYTVEIHFHAPGDAAAREMVSGVPRLIGTEIVHEGGAFVAMERETLAQTEATITAGGEPRDPPWLREFPD
jgi:hypothetical protein